MRILVFRFAGWRMMSSVNDECEGEVIKRIGVYE